MTNYLILLPTSENKKKGGDESQPYRVVENLKKYNSFIKLQFDREEIYNKLREAINELEEGELEKIFEIKEKNLQNAIELISDLLNSPTKMAISRFDGTMFKSINYEKLDLAQKDNFNESVIFIDSLFGLLRPEDLIPEYKLKISSKFLDLDVVKFWENRLSSLFDVLFREKLVIDILPENHRKIITKTSAKEYLEISFVDNLNGKIKQAGHNSKILKGEIVDYIVSRNNLTREYLQEFSHSLGYNYSQELSNKEKIVYLKY